MPIYEFECRSCNHHYDHLQRLSDDDPTVCPVCGAAQLHRKVSAPSFRLAGSGWYETDFKKSSDKKRNLVDAAPAGGEAKSGGGGDTVAAPAAAPPAAAAPVPAAAKPSVSD